MSDASGGQPHDVRIELLRKVQLFEALPDTDLRLISGVVAEMEMAEGTVLFEEGDPADLFYMVTEGAVEIVRTDADGGEEILATRRAGEGFGEMGLVADDARSATARVTEAGNLLTIRQDDFEWLLGGDSLSVRILSGLSRALREVGVRFASVEKIEDPGAFVRMESDDVSRSMQAALLPQSAPRVAGFEVAAGTTTEDVGRGGSAWDWIDLADGRTALMTLDVRKGGFPPSYHIGVARAVLRALASEGVGIPELLAKANDALSAAAIPSLDQFVEVGLLAVGEAELEWASAGQVPAGLIGRDGTFQELGAHGPPLGLMGGFSYQTQKLPVGSGDTVFVLSHGSQGLFRGAADLVAQLHGKPAGEIVTTLHRGVRKAMGDARTETSVVYVRKH